MKSTAVKNPEFYKYNNELPTSQKDICNVLMSEIEKTLTDATSRIYHRNPVWFIDDNPIVGYNVAGNGISLLFWSGQGFTTPGLTGVGKFKAAKIQYVEPSDVDVKLLRSWLKESVEIQWDYKNLRTNGKLKRIGEQQA